MKLAVILAVVVILIVSGVMLNAKPKEAIAPEATPAATEEQRTTNEMPMMNDHGMTPEEHAKMMGESSQGSDVGMEMPMMDNTTNAQGGMMDHSTMMQDGQGRMIMVSGKNFEFDVKEIRVKKGETVTIHFESADGFHDLVIDEFNVRTEKLKTGGMQMVTFTPDKTGTFEYYCSVGSHRANGMVGKLIVE